MIINRETRFDFRVEQSPAAEFAAAEFEKYVRLIFGHHLSLGLTAPEGLKIFIGTTGWLGADIASQVTGLRFDGYCLDIAAGRIIITGPRGRSLLFGVYALLKEFGCRWFFPGELGAHIPVLESAELAERRIVSNPDYELRGFSEGTHKKPADIWTVEVFELIDWLPKAGCNSLYFIFGILDFPPTWNIILPELKKRDLVIEIGTHCVHDLVPRDLFEAKPELFRMKDGVRVKDGNFCASSDEAMKMVVGKVCEVALANPDIDIMHLWFDDVVGGSWCSCEKCSGLTPASQLARVIRAIGLAVEKVRPGLKIDALLYHDTLDASEIASDLPGNVMGFYAPRERCYSHGIGDTDCARNAFYHEKLARSFGRFGKENTYIFEYYDDIILFLEMKVAFPGVMAADMRQYKAAGVDKITSLMFGRFSWWAYEANMAAFAACTWDSGADAAKLISDMCGRLYPDNAGAMRHFYDMLEDASYKLLTFCGYDGENNMNNDVKTLLTEPLDFAQEHLAGIRAAADIYAKCESLLAGLAPASTYAERERIEQQKLIMHMTARQAHSLALQFGARVEHAINGDDSDYEGLRAAMEESMRIQLELEQWIREVPYYVKGSVSGPTVLEKMLNDQYRIHRRYARIMLQGR